MPWWEERAGEEVLLEVCTRCCLLSACTHSMRFLEMRLCMVCCLQSVYTHSMQFSVQRSRAVLPPICAGPKLY